MTLSLNNQPHIPREAVSEPLPFNYGKLRNGNRPGNPNDCPRCGAKSKRTGQPCRQPALQGKTRCRLHGGLSTGPRTPQGLARSQKARWQHGYYSQEHKELWLALRLGLKLGFGEVDPASLSPGEVERALKAMQRYSSQ